MDPEYQTSGRAQKVIPSLTSPKMNVATRAAHGNVLGEIVLYSYMVQSPTAFDYLLELPLSTQAGCHVICHYMHQVCFLI